MVAAESRAFSRFFNVCQNLSVLQQVCGCKGAELMVRKRPNVG